MEKFKIFKGEATKILKDGDVIDLGNRKLVVIHTPGHSPGHICLYEPQTGYLATGDLLYQGRVNASFPTTNPQILYQSMKKLAQLPKITRILPAHHYLNVPDDLLQEAIIFLGKIDEEGNLKHGSGIHKSENLSLLL